MKGLIFVFTLFILSSCAVRSLYVPTMVNTPNFNGTNNYQINAGLSFSHVDLQLAISPYKNIGLMCNTYLSTHGNNSDISIGYYKNNLFNSRVGCDAFIGFGGGARNYTDHTPKVSLSSKEDYDIFSVSNAFNKYIAQASLYLTINQTHQISGTIRSSYLQYSRFNYQAQHYESGMKTSDPKNWVTYNNDNLSVSTFDFAFTYRCRLKMIGFFLQTALYLNNGPSNFDKNIYFNSPTYTALNTGITFYFGGNKKQEKINE